MNTFGPILAGLAWEHRGIRGMVFCDEEGERVESHISDPTLQPFDLDVAGACLAAVAPALARQGERSRLRLQHPAGILWMQMLTDHYYLVVLSHRSSTDGRMAAHLASAAEAIVMQM